MGTGWRCLVCGYLARGAELPGACPACGAPREQFAPLGRGKLRFLRDLWDTFLLHAVVAHLPNGALPAAVLFLALALATGEAGLEQACFYVLLLVAATVPLSAASGVRDWKRRYGGRRVPVFPRKLALSALLLALLLGALALRLADAELFRRGGPVLWAYAALVFSSLGPAVLLGHYGGKLVFHWRKR